MRDHSPIKIDTFNGLWRRGAPDDTPLDHFQSCNNIKFSPGNDVLTRDGIGISQSVGIPLQSVKRIYNYSTNNGNTLIVLTYVAGIGRIYHVADAATVYGPILAITGMTDFAFASYGGRAYISPFSTFLVGELNVEKGLSGEFLYVYAGDGTAARKAAGSPMTGNMTIANGAAGHTDPGLHLFAFVRETVSGYLSAPGMNEAFTTSATSSVSFGNVTASGSPLIVKRHLVATRALPLPFDGDLFNQTYYFVPGAVINNDTDLFLNNISFYDADLLEDASHLMDNYAEIPAGAVLCMYRSRLVLFSTFTDITTGLVSAPGEPEAISQIDGLITFPPDGNPVTNAQELRDILYVMKRSKTISFTDTGGAPSLWPMILVDTALGTGVHGIATVLDSGGSNVDFLIIGTFQGVTLFNGKYNSPELSYKVESLWKNLTHKDWRLVQIVNAPIQKELYIILPNHTVLKGNYSNGMDWKKIRWSPDIYQMGVNTIAIYNIDQIIIGADVF